MEKNFGIIGLGRMGGALALNALGQNIKVTVFNRTIEKAQELAAQGAEVSTSLKEFVEKTRANGNGTAVIWLMVMAGNPVDELIFGEQSDGTLVQGERLVDYLKAGDVIIDGGNSYYKDSIKRSKKLGSLGVNFFDCGTSGGISGARNGACLMIGGDKDAFTSIEWIFQSLAQNEGYGYMGKSGSGHYVKMVHNAVEYGMMQSIAEGLDLLENGAMQSLENNLNLTDILRVWNHGSIVESYLTKITEAQLKDDPKLEKIGDRVDDNGEGAWTVTEAISAQVPFLSLCYALFMRYTTRKAESFAMKVVAAQRRGFGGHNVESK